MLYRVHQILYPPTFFFKVWIIVFDRPFFDLLLLPLNRVVPARYDEELSCAMCGLVTVIKKKKREKTGQGKGGRLMSMEESNNSIHRVQKSHLLHSKTRNREASIVI